MKQVTISKVLENGKFCLIGEDGYSTSDEQFETVEAAQSAANEENALLEKGKNSERRWNY